MQKYRNKERYIPDSVKQKLNLLKRRDFIKSLSSIGVLAVLPTSLQSCLEKTFDPSQINGRNNAILSQKEWDILVTVLEILFPQDGNGPGAHELNAAPYIQYVIADKKMDPEHTDFLRNGIEWVDEEALEVLDRAFLELDFSKQEHIIEKFAKHSYGESWISSILLYIFEALLADPVYGANPEGKGWKWLEHNPGVPRPNENNKYKAQINT